MKTQNNRNLITIISVALCAVIAFTAATYCWFSRYKTVDFPNAYGGTAKAAYFAGGDGSKADPYVIKNEVHLYNFAWLQYLGYFNLNPELNNGRAQSYFKLADDIDMSGLKSALPPIGTYQYPFIGGFDGANYTVYNLTVSNAKQDLTVRPMNAHFAENSQSNGGLLLAATQSGEVSVLGLFGVVGDYNDFLANNYYNKTLGDSNIVINDSSVDLPADVSQIGENEFYHKGLSVKNFYIDKIHVKSYSKKTLLGLAAGYVNAAMQNVGVYRCDASFASGASGLTDDYGTVVSKYSLIGDYNKNAVSWEEDPTSGAGGSGDGGWGGSIDMRTMNRRLEYMYAVGEKTKVGGMYHSKNSYYGINIALSSDSPFCWDLWSGSNNIVVYIYGGTVLPLNVDKVAMGIDKNDTSDEQKYPDENAKHKTNQKYIDYINRGESVLDSNTGYIVGGGADGNSNNAKIRAGMRALAGGSYGGIYRSLGENKDASARYSAELAKNLQMFTIDSNGNKYRIKDDVNGLNEELVLNSYMSENGYTTQKYYSELGLKEYKTVRSRFDEMMDGSSVIHGFHFMKHLNENSYTTTKKNVHIAKKDYTNYELIEGGLNFTVEKPGYITAILGSFFANGKQSLFDLFEVKRDENNAVTSFKQIDKIYKDDSGKVYYDPADTSGKTLVFSIKQFSQTAQFPAFAAYYFELPVSAGDYVIGTASDSSSQNAYLMYLDIGANGDSGEGETPTPGTGKDYNMSSVDFVNGSTVTVGENGTYVTVGENGTYPQFSDVTVSLSDISESEAAQVIYKRENSGVTDSSGKNADLLQYKYKNITAVVSPEELGSDKSADESFVPSTDGD